MGWLVIVSMVCLGAVIFVLRRAQSAGSAPRKQTAHQDRHAA